MSNGLQARRIPGYEDKYLLREDGLLLRYDKKRSRYTKVKSSGDPPRVRLYKGGEVVRKYVHILLEEVFDDGP